MKLVKKRLNLTMLWNVSNPVILPCHSWHDNQFWPGTLHAGLGKQAAPGFCGEYNNVYIPGHKYILYKVYPYLSVTSKC